MQDSKLDSYLTVYNVMPEEWEEARQILVERLKEMSEMVNIRQISWYLDAELLSGQQFIPGVNNVREYRSPFRKVIATGALVAGVNPGVPHGITFDDNFTLTHMYGAATNTGTFIAEPIPNAAMTLSMDATNVIITSDGVYNRSYVIIEYLLEK